MLLKKSENRNNKRFEFLAKDYVQGFPEYIGFEVQKIAAGVLETQLKLRPDHKQQDGFVHAGVIATMADHTAGYAAYTLVEENFRILTVEFKINYFKPARGSLLKCRSRVINSGKKIIVAESEVCSPMADRQILISKAMVTLMSVPGDKIKPV
jgi:uncharacterized protein (TIGR00369 family)